MLYILMSTWFYQCRSKCFSFLQVVTNGFICFLQHTEYSLLQFPDDEYRFIGPHMADLTTDSGNGHVYYREVTSGPRLTTASNHVKQCNSGQSGFSATWVFIATWEGLTYYGGNETTPVSVSNMTA